MLRRELVPALRGRRPIRSGCSRLRSNGRDASACGLHETWRAFRDGQGDQVLPQPFERTSAPPDSSRRSLRTRESSRASQALVRLPHEALVHERVQCGDLCLCDLLGRFERAAAGEDGGREKAAALPPSATRSSTRSSRSACAGDRADRAVLARRAQRRRGSAGRTAPWPGRRELQCERHVVQAPTKLRDRIVWLEARIEAPNAGSEEADRLLVGESGHGIFLLCVTFSRSREPRRASRDWGQRATSSLTARAASTTPSKESRSAQHALIRYVLGDLLLGSERLRYAASSTSAGSRSVSSGTHQTPSG